MAKQTAVLYKKIDKVLKKCDDLLSKSEIKRHKIEGRLNHFDGHCYIAAETCYHMLGGKKKGWKSFVIPKKYIGLTTHWFLKKDNEIFDPTKNQFDCPIPYDKAKCCGFLTTHLSKRGKILKKRILTNS